MKKIHHFSVNDIVRKRRLHKTSKKQYTYSKDNQFEQNQSQLQSSINEDEIIRNIIQNVNNKLSINNNLKSLLLQIIGRKSNLSLNVSNILPKMKIRKIDRIEIIEKNVQTSSNQSYRNLHSRKLDQSHANLPFDKRKSYFVISGNLYTYKKQYEEKQKIQLKRKHFYDQQTSNQTLFLTYQQLQSQYPDFKKENSFTSLTGFGYLFQPKKQLSSHPQKEGKSVIFVEKNLHSGVISKQIQFLVADEAIFVQIQPPEFQNQYINLSGMELQKINQIIQNFTVFIPLGKKIKNYTPFFEFKQYKKNQQIYSFGDKVEKFYLIIKGQIVFEKTHNNLIRTATNTPKQSKKNSFHLHFPIKTQTLSNGNYFGQEQILLSCQQRLVSATCKSSKCQILQIGKEKFERMLDYSDFYQSLKKSAQLKYKERMVKIQKNKSIRNKFVFTQFTQNNLNQNNNTINEQNQNNSLHMDHNLTSRKNSSNLKQKTNSKFKVMHGNVIRQFSNDKKHQPKQQVKFSMLYANPDMYEKTLKKFRKYNIKTPEKYKPQINWDLKRVWKVLNLETILRQEAQVSSPQGRKFYDSHKRYLNQVYESKSFRPKTSSSTYRTKLQYIAYLQQFKSPENTN